MPAPAQTVQQRRVVQEVTLRVFVANVPSEAVATCPALMPAPPSPSCKPPSSCCLQAPSGQLVEVPHPLPAPEALPGGVLTGQSGMASSHPASVAALARGRGSLQGGGSGCDTTHGARPCTHSLQVVWGWWVGIESGWQRGANALTHEAHAEVRCVLQSCCTQWRCALCWKAADHVLSQLTRPAPAP